MKATPTTGAPSGPRLEEGPLVGQTEQPRRTQGPVTFWPLKMCSGGLVIAAALSGSETIVCVILSLYFSHDVKTGEAPQANSNCNSFRIKPICYRRLDTIRVSIEHHVFSIEVTLGLIASSLNLTPSYPRTNRKTTTPLCLSLRQLAMAVSLLKEIHTWVTDDLSQILNASRTAIMYHVPCDAMRSVVAHNVGLDHDD